MGNASGNFKGNVGSVDISLDFEIDPTKGQDEIRKFGYYFNKLGECRSIKTDERVGRFPSQKEYEQFGAALERYIFFLLRDQYKMTEQIITSTNNNQQKDEQKDSKKRKDNTCIDSDRIAKSRIYLSPEYGLKETLLLLIPGSGAVRAGQWARSICINDNLAAGCMYPFISEAYKRNWGCVLFDPNGRTDKGKIFSDEHVLYIYDKYIENKYLKNKNCKIKNILIICHSAGGMATTKLLNQKTKYLLPLIKGIAGTDTFFGTPKNKLIEQVYKKRIVNWVTSQQPLGTILSNTIPKRVSAGHSSHEYTSASAFPQIISYFDAMIQMEKNNSDGGNDKNKIVINDKSLEKQKNNDKKNENDKNENDKNENDNNNSNNSKMEVDNE